MNSHGKFSLAVGAMTLSALLGSMVGAQTFQPIDQLSVVDASGKTMGKLLDLYKGNSGSAIVALKANDLIFTAWIHRDGFETGDLCFESADCSGPAFACDCGDAPLLGAAQAAISAPGNTLYASAAGAIPRPVTFQSEIYSDGTCQNVFGGSCDAALPVQAMIDLNTMFTPPFRLVASSPMPVAACCGDCNGNGTVTVDEILTSVNYALNSCPAP
jgi:hypothetical protein